MPAKAGQTALSGSQIKPPALPEVNDFNGALLSTFRMDVGDGDFRAFAGEKACNGAANAASAAGDNCNSVL
jgi:hypothetical protein